MDNEMNKRLFQLRKKELNLTQEEFCSNINIDRSTLSNIENGRNPLMERTIDDICRAYGVSKDWLVYGNGPVFVQEENSESYRELETIYKKLEPKYKQQLIERMQHLLTEQKNAVEIADAIKKAALAEAAKIRQEANEEAQAIKAEAQNKAQEIRLTAYSGLYDIAHVIGVYSATPEYLDKKTGLMQRFFESIASKFGKSEETDPSMIYASMMNTYRPSENVLEYDMSNFNQIDIILKKYSYAQSIADMAFESIVEVLVDTGVLTEKTEAEEKALEIKNCILERAMAGPMLERNKPEHVILQNIIERTIKIAEDVIAEDIGTSSTPVEKVEAEKIALEIANRIRNKAMIITDNIVPNSENDDD